MVKNFIKMAEKAADTAKGVLFADPKLLYDEERHLLNEPFFFQGTNGKGILLLHGWTSTPYEVRRLGEYLNKNGYTVSGIMLTGHGTVPADLEDVKWTTWIDDARSGYVKLKESCSKVYVIGTSIGGNIAMMLAKENPEIGAVVLMATPYKVRLEKLMVFSAKAMLFLGKKYNRKFYPPTFGLSSTITRLISYQQYPVRSALEAFYLIREARKNMSAIKQPFFIMQSTHDHIISGGGMEAIYASVGSAVKKKNYIEKAYHTFISDIKNSHVFEDILDFLGKN